MATTADILGLNRRPAIPRRWSDHHAKLCRERDRLLDRDCSAPQSSAAKLDDLSDAGAEETLRGMTLVSAEATNATILDVLDAIRRIELGTYGICEVTGRVIEDERLAAIPWTRCSYAGQDELEKNGYGRRVRLPTLQALEQVETNGKDEDEKAESA